MLTVDFHFHGNICGLSRIKSRKRLTAYSAFFEEAELDYVVSTEHSYKEPFRTYSELSEATSDIKTSIIPGVESITKEGIDFIFIFRDKDHFASGLEDLHSYAWSVHDLHAIKAQTEAIVVMPHPFFISKTSCGSTLGMKTYNAALSHIDYIEIHNSSALNAHSILERNSLNSNLIRKASRKIDWTLDLPYRLRGRDLGWAVGSDAHCPKEQYAVGATDDIPKKDEDIFDFLNRRVQFIPYTILKQSDKAYKNTYCIMRSMGFAFREYTRKNRFRLQRKMHAHRLYINRFYNR